MLDPGDEMFSIKQGEDNDPDRINEVPVIANILKGDMGLFGVVTQESFNHHIDNKEKTDKNVESVKSCRCEKVGTKQIGAIEPESFML